MAAVSVFKTDMCRVRPSVPGGGLLDFGDVSGVGVGEEGELDAEIADEIKVWGSLGCQGF